MLFDTDVGSDDGVDVGDNIPNSLILDSSLSQHLSRTFGVPTNNLLWTLSFWWKRGKLTTLQTFFADSAFTHALYAVADNRLSMDGGASIKTTALYRDPAAFTHVQFSNNGTTTTAYVNGLQVASGATSITVLNSAGVKSLFGNASGGGYGDAYFANACFIDGQALTPSSFGRISADTGQWVPKNYTGTYGTNGFKLDFSNASALGNDSSGNGNHWTLNGGIGSTSQYVDTPTNNYAVFNPLNAPANSITSGNRRAGASAGVEVNAKSSIRLPNAGKWYAEILVNGLAVGYDMLIGVTTASNPSSIQASNRYYQPMTGKKMSDGVTVAYAVASGDGAAIGIAADMDTGELTFYKNGVSLGVAYTDLKSFVGWAFSGYCYNGASVYFLSGARPFAYPPPAGFKALCTANLPTPAILKPALHFDIKARTGTGALAAIASLAFSPDLAWLKSRSNAYDHHLFDRIRGPNKVIYSDLTAAEVTQTQSLMSFDANGYTLGTSADSAINQNGATFVDWLWKMGGAAVANNAGSIASQISANVLAGQSIVTFTGTGVAATVGHGLSKAPELIIYKPRVGASDWWVGHHKLYGGVSPWNGLVFLNTTTAQTSSIGPFANTAPTSSVFSVGVYAANGVPHVAYCFAEVEGYSKIGSYVGNGLADGPFVHCGFKPGYVMVKRVDAAGSWLVYDSRRLGYNPSNNYLLPDLANAEVSGDNLIDIVANGFKLRVGAQSINTSGGTYIFYAVAEAPQKYATAR